MPNLRYAVPMSLEDVLNSPVALPRPIPAKFKNGLPIMLQRVGMLASFLLIAGAAAKAAHPALWEKAEADIIAADRHPADAQKCQVAWLSALTLLSAANLLE